MKKLLIATALATIAGAASAQDIVRLGTEGAYPPYNFINDAGEVAGFEREFGDELCKRAGLTCEWVTNEWDSIIPNLQSGNYDVIIAGMSITDEREEVIDFSAGYLPPASSSYLALSAETDLMSGPVAAQTGTIQASFIAENGMQLVEYATPEETVAAVKNGEAVVMPGRSTLRPRKASISRGSRPWSANSGFSVSNASSQRRLAGPSGSSARKVST